jgi:hypothetical protein
VYDWNNSMSPRSTISALLRNMSCVLAIVFLSIRTLERRSTGTRGKVSSLDAALAVQLHYVNLSLVVFRMHGSRYVKLQGLGLGYTEKYIASRIIRTIDSGRLLMTSLSRVSLCLRVRLVSHDIGPSTGTKVSFDRTSPPEDG